MKLSVTDRWILANQYRILPALEGQNRPHYDESILILDRGYEEYYGYAAQYLREDDFPNSVARELKEILQMFREMQWAREKITNDAILNSPLFEFWGFDGNNSSEHYEYAQFLHGMGEFEEIGNKLLVNSHSNTLGTYQCMVEAWKKLQRKGLQLTQEDVQTILDAPKVANLPVPDKEGFDA